MGDPSGKRPDLERLTDNDEAWAMCFRKPTPGWRLLGRFVAKNVFVGLSLKDRLVLGRTATYDGFAKAMTRQWNESFPSLPVVRGNAWSDYVGGKVRDVDTETAWE